MSICDLKSYEIVQSRDLSDLSSKGTLLRHKKSGARVLLMENDDENKVFAIGFRTPPSDSTGVPHIMEHSVLCGSREFPVKDPFVELVKGSLNTFLNAMTYPPSNPGKEQYAAPPTTSLRCPTPNKEHHTEVVFLR